MAKSKQNRYQEIKGLLLLIGSFLLLLSLLSFDIYSSQKNYLGFIGHHTALIIYYLFGFTGFSIPVFLTLKGIGLLSQQKVTLSLFRSLCLLLLMISISFLFEILSQNSPSLVMNFKTKLFFGSERRLAMGGVPFSYLYDGLPYLNFKKLFSGFGTTLLFSIIATFSLVFAVGLQKSLGIIKKMVKQVCGALLTVHVFIKEKLKSKPVERVLVLKKEPLLPAEKPIPSPIPIEEKLEEIVEKINFSSTFKKAKSMLKREKPTVEKHSSSYSFPNSNLLTNPAPVDHPTLKKELQKQSKILEETLNNFGIVAKVGEINCGPTITSFEVHPAIGVKVQKIKTLANDIALNLEAKSIRIIAPIPGKAAVGVEVPSIYPQEVSFKEMLIAYQKNFKRQSIPILLGKTVTGDYLITDLTKMPHLLIAGATGSGKSVCINTIVMSILMNSAPEDIKLILIDPKKVELTQYSNLPHMIAPVITEPHGAYAALQWLVHEMQHRYEILKQTSVRNITAFNLRKSKEHKDATIEIPEKLPLIVAIFDEFADLMMVSSTDLETPIARIAQMARAVGIHLILATQRPSREVITGIIKANFPSRIAFKVASRINSQIILDETGAESLLGNGDLLFQPPGSSQLVRAQGSYVSDDDITKVISSICEKYPPNYLIPSFDTMQPELKSATEEHRDNLYDQALEIVLQAKCASTTFLQRKLKIGYARAASLMDELEANGIVGPADGSRARKIIKNFENI